MANTPHGKNLGRCCVKPPDSFLHERNDFKALVETVADSEKIHDPALVEKDYWIMYTVSGLKGFPWRLFSEGTTSIGLISAT
jgi:hypothetical protein